MIQTAEKTSKLSVFPSGILYWKKSKRLQTGEKTGIMNKNDQDS